MYKISYFEKIRFGVREHNIIRIYAHTFIRTYVRTYHVHFGEMHLAFRDAQTDISNKRKKKIKRRFDEFFGDEHSFQRIKRNS